MQAELGLVIVTQNALHNAFTTIIRVKAELSELRDEMAMTDDDTDAHIARIAEAEGRLMKALDELRTVRTRIDLIGVDSIEYAE